MALGVNGSFTFFTDPQAYLDYAQGALIPFYRDLAISFISLLTPFLFGLLLMVFEIAMGLLLLHKQKSVKIGLIGTMIFLIGITPLSIVQIPWLGLIIGEMYLLRQEFDATFIETLKFKFRPRQQSKVSNG
jgi:hypothetical protein